MIAAVAAEAAAGPSARASQTEDRLFVANQRLDEIRPRPTGSRRAPRAGPELPEQPRPPGGQP
eukprot:9518472-Alexandrium_andersonii.AAC.1